MAAAAVCRSQAVQKLKSSTLVVAAGWYPSQKAVQIWTWSAVGCCPQAGQKLTSTLAAAAEWHPDRKSMWPVVVVAAAAYRPQVGQRSTSMPVVAAEWYPVRKLTCLAAAYRSQADQRLTSTLAVAAEWYPLAVQISTTRLLAGYHPPEVGQTASVAVVHHLGAAQMVM